MLDAHPPARQIKHPQSNNRVLHCDGWMDERCFRPLLCTVKAELGRFYIVKSWLTTEWSDL